MYSAGCSFSSHSLHRVRLDPNSQYSTGNVHTAGMGRDVRDARGWEGASASGGVTLAVEDFLGRGGLDGCCFLFCARHLGVLGTVIQQDMAPRQDGGESTVCSVDSVQVRADYDHTRSEILSYLGCKPHPPAAQAAYEDPDITPAMETAKYVWMIQCIAVVQVYTRSSVTEFVSRTSGFKAF